MTACGRWWVPSRLIPSPDLAPMNRHVKRVLARNHVQIAVFSWLPVTPFGWRREVGDVEHGPPPVDRRYAMDVDRPENSDLDFRLFRSVDVCCPELREVDGFVRCGGVVSLAEKR